MQVAVHVIARALAETPVRVSAPAVEADEHVVLVGETRHAVVFFRCEERDLVRETGGGGLDLVVEELVAFDERDERGRRVVRGAALAVTRRTVWRPLRSTC